MAAKLQKLHLVMGIITVLIFLGTGVYMRLNFPEAYGTTEVIRYQYRANHIYILFCALVNIAIGLYAVFHAVGWRKNLQVIGSWLLVSSPVWLTLAFFIEPPHAADHRPLTFFGVVFSLAGMGLHFISRRKMNDSQAPQETR
jgi:hypothetical protein